MSEEEFNQNITLHPKHYFASKNFSDEHPETIDFRFAIGHVLGIYGNTPDTELFSKGPNGEQAMADRYAVFYKNGTFDFGLPSCSWVNELPQGFSCGKGSAPIKECDRIFERYVPVSCDKMVLKVAKEWCKYPRPYSLEARENPDCFAFTNYT